MNDANASTNQMRASNSIHASTTLLSERPQFYETLLIPHYDSIALGSFN